MLAIGILNIKVLQINIHLATFVFLLLKIMTQR